MGHVSPEFRKPAARNTSPRKEPTKQKHQQQRKRRRRQSRARALSEIDVCNPPAHYHRLSGWRWWGRGTPGASLLLLHGVPYRSGASSKCIPSSGSNGRAQTPSSVPETVINLSPRSELAWWRRTDDHCHELPHSTNSHCFDRAA